MTAAIASVAFGAILGGCSDLYYDRRDAIALSAGDAIAANEVAQMVDPWPAQSGNTNIAANGERMQRAVECYRADKVTTPVDLNTLPTSATQGASMTPATACAGQMSQSVAQPAAVVQTNGLTGNSTLQINQ